MEVTWLGYFACTDGVYAYTAVYAGHDDLGQTDTLRYAHALARVYYLGGVCEAAEVTCREHVQRARTLYGYEGVEGSEVEERGDVYALLGLLELLRGYHLQRCVCLYVCVCDAFFGLLELLRGYHLEVCVCVFCVYACVCVHVCARVWSLCVCVCARAFVWKL